MFYMLTFTRELMNHEERLAALRAGSILRRVVRVAIRRTFRECDALARKWEVESRANEQARQARARGV
jgi:hypothetical protein